MDALPSPSDPSPRGEALSIDLPSLPAPIEVHDDFYSDRVRCDHPPASVDGEALGEALIDAAAARDRGRVVVLAPAALGPGLEAAGLSEEARIPGFYAGHTDCVVHGWFSEAERATLASPDAVAGVQRLLADAPPARAHTPTPTTRASVDDAAAIAELIADTFEHYPTPSGVPAYIASAIEGGVPFRLVRDGDAVVACASADRVDAARTAELTDCATRPSHRGRGYMQAILADLMDDLRDLGYPTAFTLARARVPGMNLAFQRLGFDLHGTMVQSCRIGGGLEDMNIWSRRLDAAAATAPTSLAG